MKQKKKTNADQPLEIIKEILDCNKDAQETFQLTSKVDKEKSKPKPEESISERVKLKNEQIAEIKREEKNINNLSFKKYFTNYLSPSDKYKKETENEGNEDQVYSIKQVLNRLKKAIKNVPKDKKFIIKENKNIINFFECILYLNQLEQQKGKGLKILTSMLSRLPITLAQLKAGNISKKLKTEIGQLLYSLYRSKKLTKQLSKSLIDII